MFFNNDHIFNDEDWFYYDYLKKALASASDSELINDYLVFKVFADSLNNYDGFVADGKGKFEGDFEIGFDNYLSVLCHEMAMRFYKNYLMMHQEDNKNEKQNGES